MLAKASTLRAWWFIIKVKLGNFLLKLLSNLFVRVWNVHVYMCVCVLMYSARSLWSGCSSCMARVTSSNAMLVGMWWVWFRPAHKTLHPGIVLLPLQTRKQWPMGKPHKRPTSGASLCCSFFQSHTCCRSADHGSGPLAFGCCCLVSGNSFTSPEQRRMELLHKLLCTWHLI